jgi:hypothetical protein
MKTIFTVLLIAALGAGAYFYFSKKQKPSSTDPQKLIVGKWKIDSLDISRSKDSSLGIVALIFAASDSNLHKYEFEFTKDGSIIEDNQGKPGDTSYYQFASDKELLVWDRKDSSKIKWAINKLDSLHLLVQSKDSVVFSFERVR